MGERREIDRHGQSFDWGLYQIKVGLVKLPSSTQGWPQLTTWLPSELPAVVRGGHGCFATQDAALFTYQRTLDIRFAKEEAPRTFKEHKLRGAAFIGEKVMLPTNGHAKS